jgi:hypothetical protein
MYKCLHECFSKTVPDTLQFTWDFWLNLDNKSSWRRNNTYSYSSEKVNITIKKTLQHQVRWQLEKYVFDTVVQLLAHVTGSLELWCLFLRLNLHRKQLFLLLKHPEGSFFPDISLNNLTHLSLFVHHETTEENVFSSTTSQCLLLHF